MNIVFNADLSRLRRAPAQHPVLGDAARRAPRRDRHGPGPRDPPVARMAADLGLRHRSAATGDQMWPPPGTSCTTWSATRPSRWRSRPRPCGRSTTATRREYSAGRVFCAGDAVHRHPPSNGLGSNTSSAGFLQPGLEAGHGDPRPGRSRTAGHLHRGTRPGRPADRGPREPQPGPVRADLRGARHRGRQRRGRHRGGAGRLPRGNPGRRPSAAAPWTRPSCSRTTSSTRTGWK